MEPNFVHFKHVCNIVRYQLPLSNITFNNIQSRLEKNKILTGI